MDIDITIRNATLEDLQQIFGQPQTTRLAIAAQEIERGPRLLPLEEKKTQPGKPKHGAKGTLNLKITSWTPEETQALKDHLADFEEAWVAYQSLPQGTRGRSAVRQRWVILAILARRKKNGGKIQKKDRNVAERSERAPSDLIITGIDVRQIKPDKGKSFFGTARVLHRDGDLVTVKNGKGKKHTVDVKFLEIAKGPEKPKVENKGAISTLQSSKTDTKGEPAVTKPAKSAKSTGRILKCPYCEHECRSQGLHKHVKYHHPEEYDKTTVIAYIAGKNIIPPLKEEPDRFPDASPVRASDVAPGIKTLSKITRPAGDEPDPLDDLPDNQLIQGLDGLDEDNLDRDIPDDQPPVPEEPEKGPGAEDIAPPSVEDPPSPPDTPSSPPPSPVPEGLHRGQQVRHNGSKSDPHFGETGTIERVPQNLQECLVRFRLSSSWVKKDNLVPVEEAAPCQ